MQLLSELAELCKDRSRSLQSALKIDGFAAECGFRLRPARHKAITLPAVSKGKRSRRPSGHPAKVAVRGERDAARRAGATPGPDSVARRIVREAQELTSPLDAELWASHLLGVLWDQRYTLPLEGLWR